MKSFLLQQRRRRHSTRLFWLRRWYALFRFVGIEAGGTLRGRHRLSDRERYMLEIEGQSGIADIGQTPEYATRVEFTLGGGQDVP